MLHADVCVCSCVCVCVLVQDYADALTWSHFKAEGDVEFKSIMYIPGTAPYDFYDKYYERSSKGLKLYVRRVFISDDFNDLIPRYLSFLRGLVRLAALQYSTCTGPFGAWYITAWKRFGA
jgi:HSP90 family molecular chaperone